MRILVSNDDGLHSEGLDILVDFARSISDDVWIVVPNVQRSAGGHGITIHSILQMKKVEEKIYTTNGTPADCVLLAIHHIMKDKKPDLVLSGINQGENIGDDIAYSGTIAVAREAAMHGIKSISFSQSYLQNYGLNFCASRSNIKDSFNFVKDLDFSNTFYNVNFPPVQNSKNVKGFKLVEQGFKARQNVIKKKMNDRNEEYFWLNVFVDHPIIEENKIKTDIDAIANNYISVTPLSVNFTNFNLL